MRRGRKGTLFLTAGALLVAASLALTGSYLLEDRRAEDAAQDNLEQVLQVIEGGTSDGYDAGGTFVDGAYAESMYYAELMGDEEGVLRTEGEKTAVPDYMLTDNLEMPVEVIDGIGYIGVLKMPTIERELPIISKYVYRDLRTAPCRYYGSVYSGDMVICGHSYISHFRPIRKLKSGDPVIFEDVDGNVFEYTVGITEILKPRDVDKATSGEWDLTLFTCTSDSASRFTVRCMREGSGVKVMDAR